MMSEKEKVERQERRAPFEEASFMKALQEMLEKGDLDCAQMMSRMRAVCCGDPKEPGKQKEPAEEKGA
jgi:hypothetical protein